MTAFWQIHFLNARHALTRVLPEVQAAVRQAVESASAHAALPPFDLIVQAGRGSPDAGVSGQLPAPGVISMTVDPTRFAEKRLIRQVVRELYHQIRWNGPGYGRSLGAALVSEGLAGHFVAQVIGSPPDPWDTTAAPSGLTRRAVTEWAWLDYDFALWFSGGGNIRKWAGYGLGHRLIAAYLDTNPGETAASLATLSPETLRPTLRRLAGEDRAEADPDTSDDAGQPNGS